MVLLYRNGIATADQEGMGHMVLPPEKQWGKSRPLEMLPAIEDGLFQGNYSVQFYSYISEDLFLRSLEMLIINKKKFYRQVRETLC